jgi:YD repeat-containing protein
VRGAAFAAFGLLVTSIIRAQSSIIYSYDSANHLVQATSTTGSAVQYQYDPSGHLTQVTSLSPTALNLNGTQNLDISTAGQDALLNFTASADQSVTLDLSSIATSPIGSSVTVSVYGPSGTLVGSASGTNTVTLNLSSLAGGTYTVIVTPQNGATGTLQVTSTYTGGTPGGDDSGGGPLPPWTYVLLGGALLWILRRSSQQLQSRR